MVQFAIMHWLNIMVEFSKLFFCVLGTEKVTECLEKNRIKSISPFSLPRMISFTAP